MITPRSHRQTPLSSGFSLVELLVAVLIFAIGLIGVLGLQTTSLKFFHDSSLRSTAALLADDISERMRANLAGVLAGAYDNPTGNATGSPNCLGLSATGANNQSTCTAAQMAAHDFFEWQSQIQGAPAQGWTPQIKAQLPNGFGVVCIDSTPNDGTPNNPNCDGQIPIGGTTLYAIKIWWTERSDNGQYHQWIESFQP